MPCGRHFRQIFQTLLLTASLAAFPVFADQGNTAAVGKVEHLLAEIEVNGVSRGVVLLAHDGEHFFVDSQTLQEWRLPLPEASASAAVSIELSGRQYYSLGAFPGLTASLDRASMMIAVTVPPELLGETRQSLARHSENQSRFDAFGAFFDYDLALTRQPSQSSSLSGFLSPSIFTRRGSLSADILYNSSGQIFGIADNGWRRLETTWTYDDPERMRSIRVGDGLTEASGWARSLRFGGLQVASNFDTRPTEITFPQPSIAGLAAMPTTLDIYVNGQMRSQVEVPGGAFEIQDIPVVTGTGQVQVVARDLLGREQIITQDFYASERLLRQGLNAWSFSVGRLRENFTMSSNDYGESLISTSFSRGLSDRVTLGGRFDTMPGNRVGGISLVKSFGQAGISSAAIARSNARTYGTLWLVGHQFQRRLFRADFRVQGTTAAFRQPGLDEGFAFPKRQLSASTGISLGRNGSVGVSFVSERRHADSGRRIASLSYSRSLSFGLIMSVAASQIRTDRSYTEMNFSISRSLGPRTSTSFSHSRRAEGSRSRIDHRYELPSGPGFGYRTSLQWGAQEFSDAEFLLNTAFAHYSAELRHRDPGTAIRLQSRGSVAHMGGGWFVAREISDGFAVVDAGGHSDVRVYLENRFIGATRDDGRLLVPGLRPYEQNRLRIETSDIPLTVQVEQPALSVSPYYRSGALASFGVRSTRSVVLRLVDATGQPVPEGSRARLGGGGFDFPVGLNGRLYLDAVESGMLVEVLSGGEICEFVLPALEQDATYDNLGQVDCRERNDD